MAGNEQKFMINHLRDMFNGSFDDDLIESILIQRDWNVDRALDDLMALTSGCTFNIPVDTVNDENQLPELSEPQSTNQDTNDAFTYLKMPVSTLNLFSNETRPSSYSECGEGITNTNDSEDDDVIVLNQEEYCLPAESDSDNDVASGSNPIASAPVQSNEAGVRGSYAAAAAKPAALTAERPCRVKPSNIVYTGYTSYDQIKRTRDSLERVKLYANEGFKIMVILRGCSGSGKSYLARKIVEECGIRDRFHHHVHSADNYFYLNVTGTYQFDHEKLSEAHRWNQINVLHVAREGLTPIVVDNTNTQMWEMHAYARIAVCAGYEIEVMEPDTPWAFNAGQLVAKNVHRVSKNSIVAQLERYEHNIGALCLLKNFGLEYAYDNVPPQMGVRRLTNRNLIAVFDNTYKTVHLASLTLEEPPSQPSAAKPKKLSKAEKKKRKRERLLQKMIRQVRDEDTESDDSNESSVGNGVVDAKQTVVSNRIEADARLESEPDVDDAASLSEGSWSTIDENSNDEYGENNLSDDENESDSEADEDDDDDGDDNGDNDEKEEEEEEKDGSSSVCGVDETPDDDRSETESNGRNDDASDVNAVVDRRRNRCTGERTFRGGLDTAVDDCAKFEMKEEASSGPEELSSYKFSNQLYDALAKAGPRLECFKNLPPPDDERVCCAELSKDSTLENISRKLDELDAQMMMSLQDDGEAVRSAGESVVHKSNDSSNVADEGVSLGRREPSITRSLDRTAGAVDAARNNDAVRYAADLKSPPMPSSSPSSPPPSKNEAIWTTDISGACPKNTESAVDSSSRSNVDARRSAESTDSAAEQRAPSTKCSWIGLENCVNVPASSSAYADDGVARPDLTAATCLIDKRESNLIARQRVDEQVNDDKRATNVTSCAVSSNNIAADYRSDVFAEHSSGLCHLAGKNYSINCGIDGDQWKAGVRDVFDDEHDDNDDDHHHHHHHSKMTNHTLMKKTWIDDLSTSKPTRERNSPGCGSCGVVGGSGSGVKNKLCNVETEICNEADILQTVLRQEMRRKNRNDNGVNVDDAYVAKKFDRDGDTSVVGNVVKNVFDDSYENVNVFGEWNRVEKDPALRAMTAADVEGDSENSDYGSNSSSSAGEVRIADVHNSVNRFVNNDINGDVGVCVERKKANVNREKVAKNKNVADESVFSWGVDSSAPELNTLKERILINSLDKVFNHNNRLAETEAGVETPDDVVKCSKKSATSGGSGVVVVGGRPFQMIENQLHNQKTTAAAASSSSLYSSCPDIEWLGGVDNVADSTADKTEISYWNQWIRGDSWDDKTAAGDDHDCDANTKKKEKIESKPPRAVRDSPSKTTKNYEAAANAAASVWLVNDVKRADGGERNRQKSPKSSNLFSSGDLFLQAQELREFVDDRKISPASKRVNWPAAANVGRRDTNVVETVADDQQHTDAFFAGKRRRSDALAQSNSVAVFGKECEAFGGAGAGAGGGGVGVDFVLETNYAKRFDYASTEKDDSFGRASAGGVALVGEGVSPQRAYGNASDDVVTGGRRAKSDASTSVSSPKNLVDDLVECARKLGDVDSLFVPVEVLRLARNKATNTSAGDVDDDFVRLAVGRCREINDGRRSRQSSPIEPKYKCDKSTMTDGKAYTVKAKPLREDLSNMFPHDMADAILDLYEKCNGNMDWIIEILMEDGYSPSDDQLEYLSSLQNVVEYKTTVDISSKDKPSFEKKKNRSRNQRNNRKNECKTNAANAAVKNIENVQWNPKQKSNTPKEIEEEHLPAASMYADSFNDFTECVDLYMDWTSVSQLIEYFGNPTVYPIRDYQPVIKLPVSLARHLHAYLIESVIDQAEKNENLMNQLNDEMNVDQPDDSCSSQLIQGDLSEVENSFSDFLVDEEFISTRFEERNDVECSKRDELTVPRDENSFAAKFSLNLLLKAFPTIDPTCVKESFRSQNFNYFDTKFILSQYKDELPVVNMKEVSPISVKRASSNERAGDDSENEEIGFLDGSKANLISREEILEQVQKYREEAANYFDHWKKCQEKLKLTLRDKRFGVATHCREIMNEFKRKYERCNTKAASLLVTSCCFQNENIIDLHYFKVQEALSALDMFLDYHITKLMSNGRQKAILYVITGRGARSVDGVSHLQPPIKQRLKQREIEFFVESSNAGLVKTVIRKTSVLSHDL